MLPETQEDSFSWSIPDLLLLDGVRPRQWSMVTLQGKHLVCSRLTGG